MLLQLIFQFIAVAVFVRRDVTAQGIPANPCPDVFQYLKGANGDVFGRVTIPYDGSTTLNLGVNASMKGYYLNDQSVNLKIKFNTPALDLIEQKAKTLNYDVNFPFQHSIPKITRITFNNREYCSGPPEELIAGGSGVTNLWAGHKYYFQIADRLNTFNQEIQPGDNVQIVDVPAYSPKPPVVIVTTPPLDNKLDNNIQNPIQQCGISQTLIVPLILGGEEVKEGTFPWLAAMFVSKGIVYNYKCTANLISDRHVITAARCIQYFKVQVVKTEDMLFVFGRSNIAKWATNGAVTRGASKVFSHPNFDPNTADGDISVVTLDRPLQLSKTIAPICLWEGQDALKDVVDKTGTIAGWGQDEGAQNSGQLSVSVLKSLDMPIVAQDQCLYSNLSYYSITSDMTFCAGTKKGKGPCVGDSGAGFMMRKNGKYYLRGLASLVLNNKDGKCDLANYVVFCDVAKLKDWVQKAMQ